MEKRYIPALAEIEENDHQQKLKLDFHPTVLARPMPHIEYNWATGRHQALRYSSQLRKLINNFRQSVKNRGFPEVVPWFASVTINPPRASYRLNI